MPGDLKIKTHSKLWGKRNVGAKWFFAEFLESWF
jgi:hypothetical protein